MKATGSAGGRSGKIVTQFDASTGGAGGFYSAEGLLMHTATLLAEAAELARRLEYTVREEYLDGAGGGHCFFGGRKWLLLDVTQSVDEQLSVITDALRTDDAVWRLPISPQLAGILRVSRAA